MSCQVCYTRKECVSCPYCEYKTCKPCIELYLLETKHDYHCMSCRKEWTSEFVNKFESTHFKQLYIVRTKDILFEKEKALLPHTQPILHHMNDIKKIDKELYLITRKIRLLQDETKILKQAKIEHQKQICTKHTDTYLYGCPRHKCNGHITSKYECGTCFGKVCPACREAYTEHHQCNQDTIKTLQLIKDECKECPTCNTFIYRVSGCDHMWCVQCKTHFHWNSLVIERGILHNPHYFEYMTEKKRECDSYEPISRFDITHITQKLALSTISNTEQDKILGYIKRIIYLRENVYPEIQNVNEYTNQDLRIKFLENNLSEEEFKACLYRRHKHNAGYKSYKYILDTYFIITKEWLNDIPIHFSELYNELCKLLNLDIEALRKQYGFSFTLI